MRRMSPPPFHDAVGKWLGEVAGDEGAGRRGQQSARQAPRIRHDLPATPRNGPGTAGRIGSISGRLPLRHAQAGRTA